jgi:hypothetical protein
MTLEDRKRRDAEQAKLVKQEADAELKKYVIWTPNSTFPTGTPAAQLRITGESLRRRSSLEAIRNEPFQAMVEVDVKAGNSGLRLWYANTRTTTNEYFSFDNDVVRVLSWTHPGFQLALTGELNEVAEVRSYGYTLKSVRPLARARFKTVIPNVSGLYEPGGLADTEEAPGLPPSKARLKAVKLHMTQEQVQAFISKMDGFMMIFGAPGTGKTTVAFQRVRFLLDQQQLRESHATLKPYDPDLTAIFLANRNLIEYSKILLNEELEIPGTTVRYVPDFIHQYLDSVWQHKQEWRPRQKRITEREARAREAFFHLCRVSDLSGLWKAFENQVRQRVDDFEQAEWLDVCEKAGKSADEGAEALAQSLDLRGAPKSSNPIDSRIRMEHLYERTRSSYEEVRRRLPERTRKSFDERFSKWLFWVYDPVAAIVEYFTGQEGPGTQRIKAGTAEVIAAREVIEALRAEWKQRVYGPEMEAWIAWLLRFALPETLGSGDRFRELPAPVPVAAHATESRWTHVVIDEAQDLSVAEASLLSSLVDPRGALTVSADFHQVVSPVHGMTSPEALQFAGSIRGPGSTVQFPFRKNLRQSREIGRFLKDFYQRTFNEMPPFDAGDRVENFKPQLVIGARRQLFKEVSNMMKQLTRSKSVQTIALLLLEADSAQVDRTKNELQAVGLSPMILDGKGLEPGTLLISTVERAKGLEFDACIVLGLDDVERSSLNFWKNRAYVALSRPTKRLFMLCEEYPALLQSVQKDLMDVDRLR